MSGTAIQSIENKSSSQAPSSALSTLWSVVSTYPKITLAGTALAGLALHSKYPTLFNFSQTESIWFFGNKTSPTALGKAWNYLTSHPNEAVATLKGLGWEMGKTIKGAWQLNPKTELALGTIAVFTGASAITALFLKIFGLPVATGIVAASLFAADQIYKKNGGV